jgi:ABC-2 type transport system permease protein
MLAILRPSVSLCHRELVRFLRQRNRVIGALATPIVFWLLIGTGMGRSFAAPDGTSGYLTYFFPGTILMILLFTAIFSTISVIEDRREGFLQGVLVAPVGRSAIVIGKILGGAVLATAQAVLFLLLGWLTGIATFSLGSLVISLLLMFVVSLALTGLGLCIAWRMSSTQGFHAIMNLFLMPMWFLSGALFPLRDDTPQLLKAAILANPLHYALTSLRSGLAAPASIPVAPLVVTLVFTAAMIGLSVMVARGRTSSDYQ